MRILFYLIILTPIISLAQEKKLTITDGVGVTQNISLGEKGFILQTFEKLFYLDEKGNQIWKTDIKYARGYGLNGPNVTVASPSASNFYNVQIFLPNNGFTKKTHYITHIAKDGQTTSKELAGSAAFGKSLQAIFCDDNYLYYLATENGYETKENAANDKLILNRFSKGNLAHSKLILDLPPLQKEATYWSFIGQNENEKFLVSKNLDPKSGTIAATIVSFNSDGKIVKKFNISSDLNGKYLRPAYSPVENHESPWASVYPERPFANITNLDFELYTKDLEAGYKLQGTGGFCQIYYDESSDKFYAFGLYGASPFTKIGSIYEGLYIKGFDSAGKPTMSFQEDVPKKLSDQGYFRLHASPGSRQIKLKTISNGILNFSIRWNPRSDGEYVLAVSTEGKLLGYVEHDKISSNQRKITFSGPNQATQRSKYVDSNQLEKRKNTTYTFFPSGGGEILIVSELKKDIIDIYYFKGN
jgi:hypothetical protein